MKKTLMTLAAVLVASIAALAQNPLPNDPETRVGKLDNGLTYYIRHNDKPAQRCEFYLASNVGAIQEGPGQDGLAHFLEHMCFNGLKNLPGKQMLEYLQSIGASFGGNINASTGVETTQYMLNNIPVVREGIIDTCLLIMHDYSHFVLNDPVEIDNERGVILEEKRTRNTASWRNFEKSAPYYYGDTKYATTNIIGSEENLKTFKPETIVDFYETWYRPDNQAVIVVGDIDVDQIESKIKTLFADIPAPVDPRPKDVITIPENEEPVVGIITDPENSSDSYTIMWRRPAIPEQFNNTDQVYFLDVISDLVSSVMDERFNDITSKPDAPFFNAGLGNGNLMETCDALFGEVAFKKGNDLTALNAFLYEVERLKRYGVTEAELQRAKDNMLAGLEKAVAGADSRKNPEFIRPLISNFFDNTPFMDPETEYELAKMICSQVNAAMASQVMAQYITDNNMVVVLTGSSLYDHPTEKEILDAIYASRVAEVEAPKAEESNVALLNASKIKKSPVKKTTATIAGATEWTLKNGVRVVILPTEYKKDEVSIRLELPGGESLISDDELYSFEDNIWALYLQNTGLSKFSSTELSKVLSGKMASANPWIDRTSHGISANSTPKDFETALQLLYLTFTDPRFDADEYQIGIDQIKSLLPNLEKNPMFQLQKRIPTDLNEDTPRRFALSEEVIEKASLETLENVYRRLFKDAAGATVYIVGNISLDEAKPLVEKYIGALPKGKKAAEWKDDGVRFRSGSYVDNFKAEMETPKTSVLQVYTASIDPTPENKVLLSACTYILNMLYTDTLREEEGGTYGASVYGGISERPVPQAYFQVYFDTNVEQAAALEALAKKGVVELAENGPSDEFFTRTVENFKNRLPQSRISNSYWMGVLNDYYEFGYNKDEVQEDIINGLTKEKIADFLKNFIGQGNLVEIEMSPAE